MYYIYAHTNKQNGKKYVGMTKDTERRWRHNGIEYKPYEKRKESPFWDAICQYGFDNFTHEVIAETETFEMACELEKFYIKEYQTTEPDKGYNIAPGGVAGRIYRIHPKGMLGKHHNEKRKAEQAELMKKLQADGRMAWKNGHPRGMLGKHHTEEHKRYISEKMKGRVLSEETKKKIGAARKGRMVSEETRQKLSEAMSQKYGAENNNAVPFIYTLNGKEFYCGCSKDVLRELGISTTVFYKLLESGEAYVPTGVWKNKYKHLTGLKIRYAEKE